jgi:hypothetical protein
LLATTYLADWRELPYNEIWVVDTEFCPGRGLANGGRNGDPITPVCVVALELRSGRFIRQWYGEFSPFPPYRLDADALFVGFFNTAEFGVHLALGWGKPARSIDLSIEFRHLTNDGSVNAEQRSKEVKKRGKASGGYYSLAGALCYFGEHLIDTAHKNDMRDRIIQGPPFSADERERILAYCQEDVEATARLFKHLAPTIRSWPHAIVRSDFAWLTAQQERRGIPVNLPRLETIRSRWTDIQTELVLESDRNFGCYEIVNGVPHFRTAQFVAMLQRKGWDWVLHPDGSPDLSQQAFRDMAGRYPEIGDLRELRASISKMRLNSLAIGNDGRNRCLLNPYGTKTARNAPSTTAYIFGPAKWLRHFVTPPPGRVLVHRDYSQQEIRIAAVLSGDAALLAACEGGDVYLGIGEQLGFVRPSMSTDEIEVARALMKTVVLGIQYGLAYRSLALRTGISVYEAAEILARLRARFHVFEEYADRVADHAGLDLWISTQFGWRMQCPPHINPRTVRNFPVQSTAAEILHVLCALAERRSLAIVAPIHDAVIVECALEDADDVAAALDQAMRDAGAIVLRGYDGLPSDKQIIRPGEHFVDKRGAKMWEAVTRLITKLEERRA